MSIRTSIQSQVNEYPPSLRRVADAVLAEPRIVLDRTITELARTCRTSETSVVRFCRTIGFTGYAPLRIEMATELASETARFGPEAGYGSDITPTDSLADAVAKISTAEIVGIQETAASLDIALLDRIVQRVAGARRVLAFGIAASNAGAHDLTQKLLRIDIDAVSFTDAHEALVPAALLGPRGVAIGFSHGGRTRETVAFLRTARQSGAYTVAVTNAAATPLEAQADATLRTAVRETRFRSGAMASRIAQLTVVDYLFVGAARYDHDRSVASLERTHAATRTLHDDR
ncbi:MurR/RpiR family transcriptional regulator [Streptacidiphilus fuscans]|uniref:MurR/RpiR family transcriptional regulator n=1 Tax=Streptacidiphilus fuscans TaxID=2789292 RepID=A0A931B1E9_9ACTN|nr:MurR/RpiR family transcriptional regulator [Streptacidiphilus fuscans]MBF9066942.1 MurR/RpiR family transcriptional regulator [Streptacidiphilus fuscans]